MISPPPDDKSDFVIVGRIRKAHGLRGELVVEPITDTPAVIFAPGCRVFAGTPAGELTPDRRELHVERASPFKEGMIVAFREIGDRTTAELWRNRFLLLPKAETSGLADGEVYVHELLGMDVRLPSGEVVGEVVELYELPQGLAVDIRRSGERSTLVLLYEQSVLAVDREKRIMIVEIPEGMLD